MRTIYIAFGAALLLVLCVACGNQTGAFTPVPVTRTLVPSATPFPTDVALPTLLPTAIVGQGQPSRTELKSVRSKLVNRHCPAALLCFPLPPGCDGLSPLCRCCYKEKTQCPDSDFSRIW